MLRVYLLGSLLLCGMLCDYLSCCALRCPLGVACYGLWCVLRCVGCVFHALCGLRLASCDVCVVCYVSFCVVRYRIPCVVMRYLLCVACCDV